MTTSYKNRKRRNTKATESWSVNDLPALDYDPWRFNNMSDHICCSAVRFPISCIERQKDNLGMPTSTMKVVTRLPGSTSMNWFCGGTGREDFYFHYWQRKI